MAISYNKLWKLLIDKNMIDNVIDNQYHLEYNTKCK